MGNWAISCKKKQKIFSNLKLHFQISQVSLSISFIEKKISTILAKNTYWGKISHHFFYNLYDLDNSQCYVIYWLDIPRQDFPVHVWKAHVGFCKKKKVKTKKVSEATLLILKLSLYFVRCLKCISQISRTKT